jgi:hypothetical protein
MVSSVKPTPQTFSGVDKGIEIETLKAQAFTLGENFDLYFHIFNSSNGLPLDNTTANCTIHIYNKTDNSHMVMVRLAYAGNYDFEWEYSIHTSYFLETGFYPYIVWCWSGNERGGFASDELLISVDGEGELSTTSSVFVFAIILLPLLFGFLLMRWVGTLGDEHNIFKLFLSLLSVGSLLVSLWFAILSVMKFYLWVEMSEALATFTFVFGWVYAVMVFYFVLYIIKNIFSNVGKNKDERMEY